MKQMLNRMKINEVLELIKQGRSLSKVEITDLGHAKIGFRDATLLIKNGIEIPAKNIVYDDSEIEYDPDFDEVIWSGSFKKLDDFLKSEGITTDSGSEIDQETITIEIAIKDKGVQQWLEKNTSKLQKLVNKLVLDLYHTDQMLHSE